MYKLGRFKQKISDRRIVQVPFLCTKTVAVIIKVHTNVSLFKGKGLTCMAEQRIEVGSGNPLREMSFLWSTICLLCMCSFHVTEIQRNPINLFCLACYSCIIFVWACTHGFIYKQICSCGYWQPIHVHNFTNDSFLCLHHWRWCQRRIFRVFRSSHLSLV